MPSSLTGERPRLRPGATIEKTNEQGVFLVREPNTGVGTTLHWLEALVASACNGARTVQEVFELARKQGPQTTRDMVVEAVRKLKGLGLLEVDGGADDVPFASDEAFGEENEKTMMAEPLHLLELQQAKSSAPRKSSVPTKPTAPVGRPSAPPARANAPPQRVNAPPPQRANPPPPQRANPPPPPQQQYAQPPPPPPQQQYAQPPQQQYAQPPQQQYAQPPQQQYAQPPQQQYAQPPQQQYAQPPQQQWAQPPQPPYANPPQQQYANAPPQYANPPPQQYGNPPQQAQYGNAPQQYVPPPYGSGPPAPPRLTPSPPPRSNAPPQQRTSNPFEDDRSHRDDDPPPTVSGRLLPNSGSGFGLDALAGSLPSARPLDALESLSLSKGEPAAPQRPRGSALPWVLLVLVVLGAGGGGAWLYVYRPPGGGGVPVAGLTGGPSPSSKLKIDTVRSETGGGRTLVAAGFLSAPDLILVGAPIPGRIKEVKVKAGDKVTKNQVLVTLDDSQAVAELRLARARVRDAERNRARTASLFHAEAATQADLDRATGQAEIARAESLLSSQRLQQTKVVSPIDGTIIEVPVHPGEIVVFGDARPLIRLGDLRTLTAEVNVNEADVHMARPKQKVEVTSEAVPGKVFEGAVREISPQVDKARGTVLVKVDVTKPDGLLRPGLSVRATFRTDDSTPRVLLPRSALDSGTVWLVKDGVANRVPVTVQAVGPNVVEVTAGINVGDRVVLDGYATLKPGQTVE